MPRWVLLPSLLISMEIMKLCLQNVRIKPSKKGVCGLVPEYFNYGKITGGTVQLDILVIQEQETNILNWVLVQLTGNICRQVENILFRQETLATGIKNRIVNLFSAQAWDFPKVCSRALVIASTKLLTQLVQAGECRCLYLFSIPNTDVPVVKNITWYKSK